MRYFAFFRSLALLLLAACAVGGGLPACGPPHANTAPGLNPGAAGKAVVVPSTHVLLVPPQGFVLGADFPGFQQTGGTAGISVMDLAGGNFYKNSATFSRQEFENNGITVLDYRDTTLNGYPAKYACVQSDADTRTQVLTFGDTTFNAMVTGLFPATDDVLSQQMKQALFSTTYNKTAVIDPLATAPFTVDESQSKFKFALFSGNIYTYTAGGKATPIPGDDAAVIIIPLPKDEEPTAAFLDYVMERIDAMGLHNKTVKNEFHQQVNGYQAYEADVYGNLKGIDTAIHILYLTNGTNSVLIQGIAPTNYAGNLAEFKKFTRTLRFKPAR